MNKLIKFQKILNKNKLHAYLELNDSNKFYITGFRGNSYPLLFVEDKIYFFTPKMLYSQILKTCPFVTPVIVEKSLIDTFKIIKQKHKIQDLTLPINSLSFDLYKKLNNIFNLKDFYSILEDLRMIKDDEEIQNIRTACKITSDIAKKIPQIIHEKMTEIELAKEIDILLIKAAGEKAFDTIVAFGENTAYPHYIPSETEYKKDMSFLVDFGAKYNNYCADMTRTYFTNSDIFKAVKDVQNQLLNFVKPGLTAGEIDQKARELFKEKSKYFIHSTGHGVGIDIHEKPALTISADTVLKKHMVITIEPGLYIEGQGGVRIEDTILLTNKGCEILT